MRRLAAMLVLVVSVTAVGHAQLVVNDAAVTLRNAATAAVKEYTIIAQRLQHEQLRRMARRLSAFTNLAKYRLPDAPRWRTHDFEHEDVFLFARAYHAALNYGDASGAAFLDVSQPVLDAREAVARLAPAARRALTAQLATLDLASATAVSGTHDTGQLRFNGRRELQAIEALERDVTNGTDDESTTAVLAKISGAELVATRQRQARVQLLSAVVEQLLVDTKRERDTDATAIGMQLTTWRDGQAANAAFASGSGDALTTWRQP
jgi:hypothetical protein